MPTNTSFLKDIGFLSIWNITSSLINIVIFYLITNLLGPTEYGKYSLALSLVTTISLALYAAVNETLHRFSTITNDINLLNYCLRVQNIFGVIAFFGFLVFSIFASRIYSKPIGFILFIISFSFLFTPTVESVRNFLIGRKKVKVFVYLSLVSQMLLLVSILFFFIFGIRIAIAMAFLFLFISLFNFIYVKHIVKRVNFCHDGKYRKKVVTKYIKSMFLYGFFKNFFLQATLIVGSKFVNINQVAYYSFSMSIAQSSVFAFIGALHLIAVPYVTVLFTKRNYQKIARYFSAITKFGFLISAMLSLLVYIFLSSTIHYLFPEYIDVLRIIPFVLLAYTLLNFLTPLIFLRAKGEVGALTKASILATFVSFINSYFLSKYFGFKGMILSLILNVLFFSIIVFYYTRTKLGLKFVIIPNKEELKILSLFIKQIISRFSSVVKKF